MKHTLIILAGLGLAGVISAYFANREIKKFLVELDEFHSRI